MSVGLLKRNTGLMPSSCGLEEPVNITRKRLGPGTPKASVTVKHSSDGDSVKHFDLLTALFCLDFNTSQGLVSSGLICGNFCSYTVEKAMAPHSSTLAWKIPWTEEPGRLQSMGSLRVGHDWATSLRLFTFMHWRRKWHPTPVFLHGESHGRRSLVGCHLWGRTESDTTEAT